MKKIVLFTNDNSLKKELSYILPKDFRFAVNAAGVRNSVIFFDLDTMRAALIRELSEKNLLIAVTKKKERNLSLRRQHSEPMRRSIGL